MLLLLFAIDANAEAPTPETHEPDQLLGPPEFADEPVMETAPATYRITEIRFLGNDTTRPEILLQEMTVRAGDVAAADKIERSRQAIMDLGLFKSVRAELLPDEAGEGHILQVTIDEKIYLLPVPRLNRNADGDISYGMQIRGDNLFGRNQSLRLTYEETDPASGETLDQKELSLEYSYPRLAGTPYGLSVNSTRARELRSVPNSADQYEIDSVSFNYTVSRLLNRFSATRGWRINSGMALGQIDYHFLGDAVPLYENDDYFGLTGGATFSDVRDYLYSREGKAYGYGAMFGVPFDFHTHEIYFRQYNLVTEQEHSNLNYQFRLGAALGTVNNYSLGGSSTLRGYPRGGLDGNAYVLANVEYLQPLFGQKTLRGMVFLDVGNAYERPVEIDLFDLKASVGLGLRYVLKSFVNIQLRVDYAYALEGDMRKVYGGTKDSF